MTIKQVVKLIESGYILSHYDLYSSERSVWHLSLSRKSPVELISGVAGRPRTQQVTDEAVNLLVCS